MHTHRYLAECPAAPRTPFCSCGCQFALSEANLLFHARLDSSGASPHVLAGVRLGEPGVCGGRCPAGVYLVRSLYFMHLQRISLSLWTLLITTTLLVRSVATCTCLNPVVRARISRWSPSCWVIPRSLALSLSGTHNALDVALAHVYAYLEKCF